MTTLTPKQKAVLRQTVAIVYQNSNLSYADIEGTVKRLLIAGHSFEYIVECLNRKKGKAA